MCCLRAGPWTAASAGSHLYRGWLCDDCRLPAQPTTVPNPNSKVCMVNVDSGAVVLAYNPSATQAGMCRNRWYLTRAQRNPLVLASSLDGITFTEFRTLADNATVQEACGCAVCGGWRHACRSHTHPDRRRHLHRVQRRHQQWLVMHALRVAQPGAGIMLAITAMP